jgi:hypothetical protein
MSQKPLEFLVISSLNIMHRILNLDDMTSSFIISWLKNANNLINFLFCVLTRQHIGQLYINDYNIYKYINDYHSYWVHLSICIRSLHKSQMPSHHGDKFLYGGSYLVLQVFSMELTLCHLLAACNFELASRLLENLCILILSDKIFPGGEHLCLISVISWKLSHNG